MCHPDHVDLLLLSVQVMQKFLLTIIHAYAYIAYCYILAIANNGRCHSNQS